MQSTDLSSVIRTRAHTSPYEIVWLSIRVRICATLWIVPVSSASRALGMTALTCLQPHLRSYRCVSRTSQFVKLTSKAFPVIPVVGHTVKSLLLSATVSIHDPALPPIIRHAKVVHVSELKLLKELGPLLNACDLIRKLSIQDVDFWETHPNEEGNSV